jgi:hypothetical protein
MRLSHFVAAAALCAASLPIAAQTMKPGLWEINNKMDDPQMNQAMAEMQKQLAAMPPAQRKQMEEMMAKQGVRMGGGGAGGGMSAQMCMTQEMLDRNQVLMDNRADCKITRQSRSGNTLSMAYTCANPPSSGEGTMTYHSPESYSSRMKVTSTVQGKPQTMTMEGTGKWLKADCGNLKPMMPPKK